MHVRHVARRPRCPQTLELMSLASVKVRYFAYVWGRFLRRHGCRLNGCGVLKHEILV